MTDHERRISENSTHISHLINQVGVIFKKIDDMPDHFRIVLKEEFAEHEKREEEKHKECAVDRQTMRDEIGKLKLTKARFVGYVLGISAAVGSVSWVVALAWK